MGVGRECPSLQSPSTSASAPTPPSSAQTATFLSPTLTSHSTSTAHARSALLSDCNVPVPNTQLQVHASCSQRPIECPRCWEEMPVSCYFSHDEDQHPVCDSCKTRFYIPTEGKQHQLVQCNTCSQKLLMCQLEQHMADAGHAEKLLGELKVERKQLQEAEDEVDELATIQDDPAFKKMQEQHEIIQCSTFSQQYKGEDIELLEGGRVARNKSHQFQSVLINSSQGFLTCQGIYEWAIRVMTMPKWLYIGVSPPGLVGLGPGTITMPGSLALYSEDGDFNLEDIWIDRGFTFNGGDTIILRLDFTARTVAWTLKSDPSKTHMRPLPQAGP
eukprot:gnl/Dysnectes_brevis/726_a799_2598.p1 GENE.gnl/Dysnectes_brevis/726_a799_2598~~gnl/Dysnectes_brevis/726_a799_2598.p1  ORF type:complete len:330 (+),score=77.06 gnl/Dysnectes_brevis/726_a799_2598:1491-2480(+)